jgi:hypothetical protein
MSSGGEQSPYQDDNSDNVTIRIDSTIAFYFYLWDFQIPNTTDGRCTRTWGDLITRNIHHL